MQPTLQGIRTPYVTMPTYRLKQPSIIDVSIDKLIQRKIQEAQFAQQQQAVASRTPTVLTDPLLNFRVRDYYQRKYAQQQNLGTELLGRAAGAVEGASLGAGIAATVASIVATIFLIADNATGVGLLDEPAVAGSAAGVAKGIDIIKNSFEAVQGIARTAAAYGAIAGAGIGAATSDYSTWFATKDMFANLYRNQGVGRGFLNTMNFVGQTMDLTEGATIIKSTLYGLINSENIGEVIARSYGMTNQGRTDMDFSLIRESLGFDLGGIGNFIFDMTGEFVSDPGSWSGVLIPLLTSRATTKAFTESIGNFAKKANVVTDTIDETTNAMKSLSEIAKNEKQVKQLAKVFRRGDVNTAKEMLSKHNPITEETTKKLIDAIQNDAFKKTSVKLLALSKGHDFVDDTLTHTLWRAGNPGVMGIHAVKEIKEHQWLPTIIKKLWGSEASEKFKDFLYGNNALRNRLNRSFALTSNRIKKYIYGNKYYKYTQFYDVLKNSVDDNGNPLNEVYDTILKEHNIYTIEDLINKSNSKTDIQELKDLRDIITKKFKEHIDNLEKIKDDKYKEFNSLLENYKPEDQEKLNNILTDIADLDADPIAQYYKTCYLQLTDPNFFKAQEEISFLYRMRKLHSIKKKMSADELKDFNASLRRLFKLYDDSPVVKNFFDTWGNDIKNFVLDNVDKETSDTIKSIINTKANKIMEAVSEKYKPYQQRFIDLIMEQINNNPKEMETFTKYLESKNYKPTKSKYGNTQSSIVFNNKTKKYEIRSYYGYSKASKQATRIDKSTVINNNDNTFKILKEYTQSKTELDIETILDQDKELTDLAKETESLQKEFFNFKNNIIRDEKLRTNEFEKDFSSHIESKTKFIVGKQSYIFGLPTISDARAKKIYNDYINSLARLFSQTEKELADSDDMMDTAIETIVEEGLFTYEEMEPVKVIKTAIRSLYFSSRWNASFDNTINVFEKTILSLKNGNTINTENLAKALDTLKNRLMEIGKKEFAEKNYIAKSYYKRLKTIYDGLDTLKTKLDKEPITDFDETLKILGTYRKHIRINMLKELGIYNTNKDITSLLINAKKRVNRLVEANKITKETLDAFLLIELTMKDYNDILTNINEAYTKLGVDIGSNNYKVLNDIIDSYLDIKELSDILPMMKDLTTVFKILTDYNPIYKTYADELNDIFKIISEKKTVNKLVMQDIQNVLKLYKEFNNKYSIIEKYLPNYIDAVGFDKNLKFKFEVKTDNADYDKITNTLVNKFLDSFIPGFGEGSSINFNIKNIAAFSNSLQTVFKNTNIEDLDNYLKNDSFGNVLKNTKAFVDKIKKEQADYIESVKISKAQTNEIIENIKQDMASSLELKFFNYNYYNLENYSSFIYQRKIGDSGKKVTPKSKPIKHYVKGEGTYHVADTETTGKGKNILTQITFRSKDGSSKSFYLNPNSLNPDGSDFDPALKDKGITLDSLKELVSKSDPNDVYNSPAEMMAAVRKFLDADPKNPPVIFFHNATFDLSVLRYNSGISLVDNQLMSSNKETALLPDGSISRSVLDDADLDSTFNYDVVDTKKLVEANIPILRLSPINKQPTFQKFSNSKFLTNTDLGKASTQIDVYTKTIDANGNIVIERTYYDKKTNKFKTSIVSDYDIVTTKLSSTNNKYRWIYQEYDAQTGTVLEPEYNAPGIIGDIHTAEADTEMMSVWLNEILENISDWSDSTTFETVCDPLKVMDDYLNNVINNAQMDMETFTMEIIHNPSFIKSLPSLNPPYKIIHKPTIKKISLKDKLINISNKLKIYNFDNEVVSNIEDINVLSLFNDYLLDIDFDNLNYYDVLNIVNDLGSKIKNAFNSRPDSDILKEVNDFIEEFETLDVNLSQQANRMYYIMFDDVVGNYQLNKGIVLTQLLDTMGISDPNNGFIFNNIDFLDLQNFFNGNYDLINDYRLKDLAVKLKEYDNFFYKERMYSIKNKINSFIDNTVFLSNILNDIPPEYFDSVNNVIDIILNKTEGIDIDSLDIDNIIKDIKITLIRNYKNLEPEEMSYILSLLNKETISKLGKVNSKTLNELYFEIKHSFLDDLKSAQEKASATNTKPTLNGLSDEVTQTSSDTRTVLDLSKDFESFLNDAFGLPRTLLSETKKQNARYKKVPITLSRLNQDSEIKVDSLDKDSPLYKYLNSNRDEQVYDGYHRLRPKEAAQYNSTILFKYNYQTKRSMSLKNTMNKIEDGNFKERTAENGGLNALADIPIVDAEHSKLMQNYFLAANILGIDVDYVVNEYYRSGNYKNEYITKFYNDMFEAMAKGEISLDEFKFNSDQKKLFIQFYTTVNNINENTYSYIKDVDQLKNHIIGAFMHQLYNKHIDNGSRLLVETIDDVKDGFSSVTDAYKFIYGKQATECLYANEIFDEAKKIFIRGDGTINYDGFRQYLKNHPQYTLMSLDTDGRWIRLNYMDDETLDYAFNPNSPVAIISKDSYTSYVSEHQKYNLSSKAQWFKNYILRTMKVAALGWNMPFIVQNAGTAGLQNTISTDYKFNIPRQIKKTIETANDYYRFKRIQTSMLSSPIAKNYINKFNDFDNFLDLLRNDEFITKLSKSDNSLDKSLFRELKNLTDEKIERLFNLNEILHTAAASGEINEIMEFQLKQSKNDEDYKLAKAIIDKENVDKTTEEYKDALDIVNNRNKYTGMSKAELEQELNNVEKQLDKQQYPYFHLNANERRRLYNRKAVIERLLIQRKYNTLNTVMKLTATDKFLNFNNDIEAIFRTTAIRCYIEDGLSFDEATWETIKRQFIYTDKSLAEQYAEFVIPFVSYPIRAAALWEDLCGDANIMDMFYWFNKYSWGRDDNKQQQKSDYLSRRRARGDVPVGDKLVNIMGNPLGEAVMSAQNPMYTINNKLNPLAKPLVDLVTGSQYNRWTQLPVISNINNATQMINERNIFSSFTNDYYRYNQNGNYYLPRVNNRIGGTVYNKMYTKSGYSRVQMRMSPLTSSNLKYRINDILRYSGPTNTRR